jgi:hypothetical protein
VHDNLEREVLFSIEHSRNIVIISSESEMDS